MIKPTHRENDQGTIAAELLKLLGVTVGLGLGPLLSDRLGWYWAIGMAAGGMMLVAGAALSLSIDRRFRRQRAEKLRERLLQETSLLDVQVQVYAPPRMSQALLFSNPRLAALRASLQAGWISERQFSAQAGQVLNEMALAQTGEQEDFSLPNTIIALGVFILVPALIAWMVIANRIQHPAEIAAYFSSPALLLWLATEGLRLSDLYRERPWTPFQWLSALSGLIYLLSALAFWVYLGLFFGEALRVWLFVLGASLAVIGAALSLGLIAWQRRSSQQGAAANAPSPAGQGQQSASVKDGTGNLEARAGERALLERPAAGAAAGARFEIFQGKDGKYYFRLRASNGEIILTSQGYTTLQACRKGIRSVRANAGLPNRYRARTDRSGEPYFVLLAGNHEVIGRSESYSSQAACERGIRAVQAAAGNAAISEVSAPPNQADV